VDYLNYTNLPANWSYGDFPDGQPFYRQQMFEFTPGTTNSNASVPITIAINEWMADNGHTIVNPVSELFDDWFELYNYGTNTVDLGGFYLTATLTNKTKFLIPNTHQYLVEPQSHFLVWADNGDEANSTNRPELHVNFRLSKSGEAIGLFAANGTAVDTVVFGPQAGDVSQGRYPDGAVSLFSMPTPTPRASNVISNTAPVLAEVADQFVHAGQTVEFTATATDAQGGAQALTFSLSNAPADASIHPSTGMFSWATANATAPGTHRVTVRVTDNGTPPLSDVRTFSIVIAPQPRITGVNPTQDGYIQLAFDTLPGRPYQVQFKDRLSDPVWVTLGGTITGDGSAMTIYDEMTGRPQRFYQLLALP
jgi:hypothetical protein